MADISKVMMPGEATARSIKDATARQMISELTTGGVKQYTTTLSASKWSNGTYTYSLTALKCGDGTVSPIIAPADSSNHGEYDKIATATATAGTGIVFVKASSETISEDIPIIIIDFQ